MVSATAPKSAALNACANLSDSEIVRFTHIHCLSQQFPESPRLANFQIACFSESQSTRLSDPQIHRLSDSQNPSTQTPCFSGTQILRMSYSLRFTVSSRISPNCQDSRTLRLRVSQNLKVPESQTLRYTDPQTPRIKALRLSDSQTSDTQIHRPSDPENPRTQTLRFSDSQTPCFSCINSFI